MKRSSGWLVGVLLLASPVLHADIRLTYWDNVTHEAVTTTDAALIARARALPIKARLMLINRVVNQAARQMPDKVDEWRGLDALIKAGEGDCEDFALAKYQLLRRSGVEDRHLRLLAAKDQWSPTYHMVLRYQDGTLPSPLILDNLTLMMLPMSRRDDLDPLYSFNATTAERWKNGKAQTIPLSTGIRLDGTLLAERAARLMTY
ncbi:transglutaminase-like cysteine peptidase [Larsenimonas rhizosphaerae]|uniref:Transglutaminase-like cysteine peptidase n=1 Tax=Larsenimonas rhizosphaerae TaxID=2944682 RepID=A0AA41ZE44_9GAMM|nr:transglutaminase-like cysteine peptidase [Larsenimonas rhizosphaerae]MCX2522886.1 transglutaminase-like cysteine peptidase [Larsenimonas rhizosphaerae]